MEKYYQTPVKTIVNLNFSVTVIIILLVKTNHGLDVNETGLTPENKEGYINSSDNVTYVETLGGSTNGSYSTITWKYKIILYNYAPDESSPIIYFRHEGQEDGYGSNRGCVGGEDYGDLFGYDPRLVIITPLQPPPGSDKQCILDPFNATVLVCEGTLKIAVDVEVQWYVSALFECGTERPLDIWYNISVIPHDLVPCRNTADALDELQGAIPNILQGFVAACASLYDEYTEFNILGLQQLDFLLGFQLYYRAEDIECYQQLLAFTCYIALPKCVDGHIIHSCAEMCQGYKTGCSDSTLGTSIECNSLSSKDTSDQCFYSAVYCLRDPEIPENAKIVSKNGSIAGSIATFECEAGFESTCIPISKCHLSGNWVADDYCECHKIASNQNIFIAIVVCTVIVVIIIIMTAMSCLLFRFEMKLLQKRYIPFHCFIKKNHIGQPKFYHAFIAYQHDWYHFVKDEIHEKLQSEGYKIFTDYNDILFGEDLTERIPEAISQSYRVIIILNQMFLDSKWCKYELRHSFVQMIEDNYFDVLVILTEDPKDLKNVPRYLRAHLRTKLYLKSSSGNLTEQIKKTFPAPDACVSPEKNHSSALDVQTIEDDEDE